MKGKAPPARESVWSYPRPPRLEPANRHIRVVFAGETVADRIGILAGREGALARALEKGGVD